MELSTGGHLQHNSGVLKVIELVRLFFAGALFLGHYFMGIKSYIGDLCVGCACVRVCACIYLYSVLELIGINKRNEMERENCFGIFKVMKCERIQPKGQISRTRKQIMCNLKRRVHYKRH